MTVEFRVGDKITVEYEVTGLSRAANGNVAVQIKSGLSYLTYWESDLAPVVKEHVPAPRLPKAGETWIVEAMPHETRTVLYVDDRSVLYEDSKSWNKARYLETLSDFMHTMEPAE